MGQGGQVLPRAAAFRLLRKLQLPYKNYYSMYLQNITFVIWLAY
jgi:hypothetical protein